MKMSPLVEKNKIGHNNNISELNEDISDNNKNSNLNILRNDKVNFLIEMIETIEKINILKVLYFSITSIIFISFIYMDDNSSCKKMKNYLINLVILQMTLCGINFYIENPFYNIISGRNSYSSGRKLFFKISYYLTRLFYLL